MSNVIMVDERTFACHHWPRSISDVSTKVVAILFSISSAIKLAWFQASTNFDKVPLFQHGLLLSWLLLQVLISSSGQLWKKQFAQIGELGNKWK